MPLNHIQGEPNVEGMDPVYRVVPLSKYQEATRLTTEVKETVGKKFKREVTVERPIWAVAHKMAMYAFLQAGAPPGSKLPYDCIAQEYPRTGIVCFIFNATINGTELYVRIPVKLGDAQIADLVLRNQWQPFRVN
jgi:hypothetical protein